MNDNWLAKIAKSRKPNIPRLHGFQNVDAKTSQEDRRIKYMIL